MLVTSATVRALFVNLKQDFQKAYQEAPSTADLVSMRVPSSSKLSVYAWLGQFPNIREWLGDKVLNDFQTHDYTLTNKDWEMTMAVDRNDIEDDTFSMFSTQAAQMGLVSKTHPDQILYALLNAGTTTTCYDGQFFFDTDHPRQDGGAAQANYAAGGGVAWYLMSLNRPMKPLIHQVRKPYTFIQMIEPTDERVFSAREFRYGIEARSVPGYGLWQTAYRSNLTLNATNYAAARAAMSALVGDQGRPLGIYPTHLVVPPSLESAGLSVVKQERNDAGASNIWYNSTQLAVVPFLTNA